MVVKARAREGDLDFLVGGVDDEDDEDDDIDDDDDVDDDKLIYESSSDNFLFNVGFAV